MKLGEQAQHDARRISGKDSDKGTLFPTSLAQIILRRSKGFWRSLRDFGRMSLTAIRFTEICPMSFSLLSRRGIALASQYTIPGRLGHCSRNVGLARKTRRVAIVH